MRLMLRRLWLGSQIGRFCGPSVRPRIIPAEVFRVVILTLGHTLLPGGSGSIQHRKKTAPCTRRVPQSGVLAIFGLSAAS